MEVTFTPRVSLTSSGLDDSSVSESYCAYYGKKIVEKLLANHIFSFSFKHPAVPREFPKQS